MRASNAIVMDCSQLPYIHITSGVSFDLSPEVSNFVTTSILSVPYLLQAARVKKYKLKTHHAVAKRWKALASGLFKRVNIPLFYMVT